MVQPGGAAEVHTCPPVLVGPPGQGEAAEPEVTVTPRGDRAQDVQAVHQERFWELNEAAWDAVPQRIKSIQSMPAMYATLCMWQGADFSAVVR